MHSMSSIKGKLRSRSVSYNTTQQILLLHSLPLQCHKTSESYIVELAPYQISILAKAAGFVSDSFGFAFYALVQMVYNWYSTDFACHADVHGQFCNVYNWYHLLPSALTASLASTYSTPIQFKSPRDLIS